MSYICSLLGKHTKRKRGLLTSSMLLIHRQIQISIVSESKSHSIGMRIRTITLDCYYIFWRNFKLFLSHRTDNLTVVTLIATRAVVATSEIDVEVVGKIGYVGCSQPESDIVVV